MAIIKFDILNHADYAGEFREHQSSPGLSRFYTAIESVRSLNRENTLLLDAGDNINRILWHGDIVFEGLARIGTDVHELGNHEFDEGREPLEASIRYIKDRFPIICSNVVYKENKQLMNDVEPYVILERSGVKIGVLGCITEYTPYMVEATAFSEFEVTSAVEACRKYIPEMREKGAEIIIVLTHFPFYFTDDSESGELIDVYRAIEDLKPDAMIGGHIPGDYARVLGTCAITKGGFGGKSLPHTELYFDTETRKVVDRKCSVIDVMHGNFEKDPEIEKFVREATSEYDYFFEDAFGEAVEDIPMRLSVESPMADLLCDIVRNEVKTDFVYFNCTSCGRGIPKGPIVEHTMISAMGFNDPLHKGTYTGQDLWDLFTCVYEPERFGNNGNIMFSGLNVVIDNTKEHPHKVVSIKTEDGKDVELDKEYTVVTSEYMASGGNGTRSVSVKGNFENTNVPIHDVFRRYINEYKELRCPTLGRYINIGPIDNDNSPW